MSQRAIALKLLLIFCLSTVLTASVWAGDYSKLDRVGERVRVYVDTSVAGDIQFQGDDENTRLLEVEGMVLTSEDSSITIRDEHSRLGTRTLALDDVRAGFVYGGKRNQGLNGAIAGAVLGVLVGVLIDSDGDDGGRSFPSNYSERENRLGHYLIFAGLGAFVGGVSGMLIEEEVWHRVEQDQSGVSVGVGYDLEKKQVMLSLRF